MSAITVTRPQPAQTKTERAAAARNAFAEAVQWSRLDLLDYDNNPARRAAWERVIERERGKA